MKVVMKTRMDSMILELMQMVGKQFLKKLQKAEKVSVNIEQLKITSANTVNTKLLVSVPSLIVDLSQGI